MTQEKLIISDEIKAHLTLNSSTESYRHLPGEFEKRDGVWACWIDWDKVREYHISGAKKNLEILEERKIAFDKIAGPRVGDYLSLPHGIMTRFTHDWGEEIQIGGGSGSFYFGNGYMSYSGGLDPSIEKKYIIQTDEKKDGMVWFFHENSSGGGRGVHFYIPFRVFKLEGYDTSKIWMVQDKEKEIYREKAEKITRRDGNGNEYTLPIPEIHLLSIDEEQIKQIERVSGLKFKPSWNGAWVQPLKQIEIENVRHSVKWADEVYYNNASVRNAIYFHFKKPNR